jgi:hypothetical protein
VSRLTLISAEVQAAIINQDESVRTAAQSESMDAVRYKAGLAAGLRQALAIIQRNDSGE